MQLKHYIFFREVCKIIGFHERKGNSLTAEQLMTIGRDTLDRVRFTGQNEGVMTLAKACGVRRVQAIYAVDQYGANLDEAMQVVHEVKKERGII